MQVLTSPKELFAGNINYHLYNSRVFSNLNWNIEADKWEILWHSLDLQGILFLMAMLDSLGEGTILSCPKCGQFFVTTSKLRKFCSVACGNQFKVRNYERNKKKKEPAAQKGKKTKSSKPTTQKK